MNLDDEDKEAGEILRSLLSTPKMQNPQQTEVNYWQPSESSYHTEGNYQSQEQIIWQIDPTDTNKQQQYVSNVGNNPNVVQHIPVTYLTTDERNMTYTNTRPVKKPLTYVLSRNVIAETGKYCTIDGNAANIIVNEPQKIVLLQEISENVAEPEPVYNNVTTRVFRIQENHSQNQDNSSNFQLMEMKNSGSKVVMVNSGGDNVKQSGEVSDEKNVKGQHSSDVVKKSRKKKDGASRKTNENPSKTVNVEKKEECLSEMKSKVEKKISGNKKPLKRRKNAKLKSNIKTGGKNLVKKPKKNFKTLEYDKEDEKTEGEKSKGNLFELTKLEDNADQVAERFKIGCECSDSNCFDGLNPEKVFKHRLNIADLTKAEHDMYLMGVIMASIQNPEETCRHKERIRIKSCYAYQGKKVCLNAFLYLQHVTLYQMKRLRSHLKYHGVSPRIHGNHGRKPANTFSLDIYRRATNFVQSYIEKHCIKSVPNFTTFSSNKIGSTFISGSNFATHDSKPGKKLKKVKIPNKMTSYHLPPECTKKTVHREYKSYCESLKPSQKVMQYSTFTSFLKKQFPNVKFQKVDKKQDEKGGQSEVKTSLIAEDAGTKKPKKSKKILEEFKTQNVGEVPDKSIQTSTQVYIPGKTVHPSQPTTFIIAANQIPQVYNTTQIMETSIEKNPQIVLTNELSDNLAVRDVADLLYTQYAIITGGKTENGCPIITFPDIGNFSTLGDLEYQRLMTYLTSVPSMQEADIGFVLVIDRRNDKWNSVKPTLLKLSGYFPGIVHAVYVLRPSGIIKKTISDVLNKLFKEDFKFKVTICNSLEELHTFIDKSQLTPDLGGLIQYNHTEWIHQREELEKFSTEMKEVSMKLDNFTKKVQETEVPTETKDFQDLLSSQQAEYGVLKDEILNAAKHGENLLEVFRTSQASSDENTQIVHQNDKLGNVAAVERLLVQLEETERTFCEFQTELFQNLRQCLDRRIFDQDVAELDLKFDQHLKTVNDMVEVGESVSRVDTLIKETNAFQKICLADIDRAEEVISNGQRLLKTKQYSSEETLETNCYKLKKLCIILTERIEHRLDTLKKHRELQEQIDKANAWCASGIELLSTQHIEKASGDTELIEKTILEIKTFLSTAETLQLNSPKKLFKDNITPETKALVTQVVQRIADVTSMCDKRLASLQLLTKNRQRPVQTVTPEPGVPLQPCHGAPVLNKPKILRKANTVAKLEDPWNQGKANQFIDKDIPTQDPQVLKSKRQHILAELLETEQVYVSELNSIIKGYKEEMESPEMKPLVPPELVGKGDILFGNLEEIYTFHNGTFLKDLQNCISTTELVALCFTHRKNEFYKLYSCYCQNSPKSEQLREIIGERNFFFGACQIKLGHKLPLAAYLLKPIQRITKYQLLLKDLLRSSEEPKCRGQLQEALKCMLVVLKCVNDSMHQIAITGFRGDLSEQGELLMQGSFSIWTETKKIRELRLTPMQRHVFLYRKAILFCKKENKENNKATYHFKRFLQMSQIGLTESVKGDPRKFEIWLQGRQQVHTIQASTVEQKSAWVQQIKEVLLEQLAELRGANMRQYSLNKTPVMHRTLRQTTSWESQSSMDSSAGSNNRAFSCDETNSSHIQTLLESEEESSDLSNSDDEETFSEQVPGARYVVQADYRSQGHNEISLQEGTLVEILKVGCGGWWYVKLLDHYFQGQPIEGWAPSAYLEPCSKKDGRSNHKNMVSQVVQ